MYMIRYMNECDDKVITFMLDIGIDTAPSLSRNDTSREVSSRLRGIE